MNRRSPYAGGGVEMSEPRNYRKKNDPKEPLAPGKEQKHLVFSLPKTNIENRMSSWRFRHRASYVLTSERTKLVFACLNVIYILAGGYGALFDSHRICLHGDIKCYANKNTMVPCTNEEQAHGRWCEEKQLGMDQECSRMLCKPPDLAIDGPALDICRFIINLIFLVEHISRLWLFGRGYYRVDWFLRLDFLGVLFFCALDVLCYVLLHIVFRLLDISKMHLNFLSSLRILNILLVFRIVRFLKGRHTEKGLTLVLKGVDKLMDKMPNATISSVDVAHGSDIDKELYAAKKGKNPETVLFGPALPTSGGFQQILTHGCTPMPGKLGTRIYGAANPAYVDSCYAWRDEDGRRKMFICSALAKSAQKLDNIEAPDDEDADVIVVQNCKPPEFCLKELSNRLREHGKQNAVFQRKEADVSSDIYAFLDPALVRLQGIITYDSPHARKEAQALKQVGCDTWEDFMGLDSFNLLKDGPPIYIKGISDDAAAAKADDTALTGDKFKGDLGTLVTGTGEVAARGLEYHIRAKNKTLRSCKFKSEKVLQAIREEFINLSEEVYAKYMTRPKMNKVKSLSFIRYILDEEANNIVDESNAADGSTVVRDKDRKGMALKDFADLPQAKEAKLKVEHVAALRIYTSSLFQLINRPFREINNLQRFEKEHPVPVTVLLIHEALKKLRTLQAKDSGPEMFWRGMKDLKMSKEFVEHGGTELAPMSTSTNMETIGEYCKSENPLIFSVVSDSFMNRGSDISWLSLYPGESEVLYPPLTFLKPLKRRKIQGSAGWVIEVSPSIA